MILILSSPGDDHAVAVMRRLDALGAAHELLDLSRFPRELELEWAISEGGELERCRFHGPDGEVDLRTANVVWWRRPQPFELHKEVVSATERLFAHSECHEAVAGVWLTLDAFWVNHPTRDDDASRKLNQLRVAAASGLEVPVTCVTNDPSAAIEFVERSGDGKVIYKSFTATEEAWRETRLLKRDELDLIGHVRYAPVIFQELVPAEADLRVTIFGNDVFAVAVRPGPSAYTYDYRMDLDSSEVEPFELPRATARRLRTLVGRLGLVYGAIDMRLTPDGRFVFLEVNPSGQWLFLEERTGLPITDRFAELLASHDASRPSAGGTRTRT